MADIIDFRVKNGLLVTTTATIDGTTQSTSSTTGALKVAGGVGIQKDVNIGGTLYVSTTSFINNSRILVASDLETVTTTATFITNDPTSQVGLAAIANTTTVYGTYNFGDVSSITTANDYNTATNVGFYSINDASGAPGYVVYVGFTNVTNFTRLVLNLNYTATSGHTVELGMYNFLTSSWDTFTTYSGSTGWTQFILETFDDAPYISSGKTYARLYHSSSGNTAHRTWIDYVVLQDSIQGGQGPRGATGATGAQGPQGLTTTTTSTFIFNNTTNSLSTASGSVVTYGGVGIAQDVYVGGSLTVNGTVNATVVGIITTATNLFGGTAGKVPYQTAAGTTNFFGPGTAGDVLVSNGTSAPSYNNTLTLAGTTSSISTTTGVLQVRGGAGVGGSLYVGNRVGFVGTTGASVVYQYYNTVTNSLDTVFG